MSQRTPLGVARVAVVYLFVAALVWISQPTPLLVAIGLPFVVIGEAVRFWAAGHLLKSKELAVSGPYRYTQNPLYLGRFLILTGFCVMAYLPVLVGGITIPANLLVLAVSYAVFFFYYLPRKVRVEGSRLAELHGGAWREYFDSVPILFPRLTPHGTNVRAWDATRMKRNREHWMLAGVTAVAILFLVKAALGGRAGTLQLRPVSWRPVARQASLTPPLPPFEGDARSYRGGTAELSTIWLSRRITGSRAGGTAPSVQTIVRPFAPIV